MLYVKEPLSLSKSWTLSSVHEETSVVVPSDVTKLMRNYHVLPVEFLYHNYRKGLKGSILNEEQGMNFPLQIAAFLRAVIINSALVLVVCSQRRIWHWHHHLSVQGKFEVIRLNNKNLQTNFESGNNTKLVLLLPFPDLKLAENLWHNDFFSVIVDDFDEVANKMIFRRLNGNFNIGLSLRNFYKNPDQKLQWKMLNWSNPGCVGKLLDFYEIDNENFRNFRDNYRFWWFRLTWKFCESFQTPTQEQLNEYENCIEDWAKKQKLPKLESGKRKRKTDPETSHSETSSNTDHKEPSASPSVTNLQRNRISHSNTSWKPIIFDESAVKAVKKKDMEITSKRNREVESSETDFPNNKSSFDTSLDKMIISESECSSDTIILDSSPEVPEYLKLPNVDENPILTSIIKNFKDSPDPVSHYSSSYNSESLSYPQKESNCFKSFHEDSVIFSIMDIDRNGEKPCSSKSLFRSQSEEFIISLIENNRSEKKTETCLTSDVKEVLDQADSVLQNWDINSLKTLHHSI